MKRRSFHGLKAARKRDDGPRSSMSRIIARRQILSIAGELTVMAEYAEEDAAFFASPDYVQNEESFLRRFRQAQATPLSDGVVPGSVEILTEDGWGPPTTR